MTVFRVCYRGVGVCDMDVVCDIGRVFVTRLL